MTVEPVVVRASIDASPELLYDLVADVSRMGEWSPEATGARQANKTLQAGDTFIGTNRRGPVRWYTQCTVLTADRGSEFAFDVNSGPLSLSRWSYRFEPTDSGTLVTESWWDRREGITGLVMKGLGQFVIPGNRAEHNRRTMEATLQQLKATAESL